MTLEEKDALYDELITLKNQDELSAAYDRLYDDYRYLIETDLRFGFLALELLFETEDYEDIIDIGQVVKELITDDLELAKWYRLVAAANYYTDQYTAAQPQYNEAIRLDPTNFDGIIDRAILHEDMGFLHAALIDVNRAISIDDTVGQPYAVKANIYQAWGQFEECQDALEKAVALDPDDLESAVDLARLYALNQRTTDSMELLTTVLSHDRIDEHDPEIIAPAALLRSQLSTTLGSMEAAMEDADYAQTLIPDLPWAYLQMAAIKIHQQVDAQTAIKHLKKAQTLVDDIRDLPDLYPLFAAAYRLVGKEPKAKNYDASAEGFSRLPSYVYGDFNPVENIPINPNKPLDIRRILTDLFGSADKAPEGLEETLRDTISGIMNSIEDIRRDNPQVNHIEIKLPDLPGMIGTNRSVIITLGSPE